MRNGQLDRRSFVRAAAGVTALPFAASLSAAIPGERQARVRHYVIATRDMHFVTDQIYEFLGLAPLPKAPGPGVTEAYGFYSTMMKVGTTMIEVVQPIKADHHLNGWLDERGGDGGYMVVMQTFADKPLLARAKAEGLKITRDMMFKGQHMIQFDYRHFGTHFEFYLYSPEEDWWGDPNNRPYPNARVASDIIGGEVAVENPAAIAAQAARVFNGDLAGERAVRFGDRTIAFSAVAGRKRGLISLDLKARESRRVGDWARIGGVQWKLV